MLREQQQCYSSVVNANADWATMFVQTACTMNGLLNLTSPSAHLRNRFNALSKVVCPWESHWLLRNSDVNKERQI